MTTLTRIVAAIVDTKKATLYKEDGTTIIILQGDARLRPLLETITPQLVSQNYADVDLSVENSYKEFEEKTGGAVRFFRIAKSKLASIFGTKEENTVPSQILGVENISNSLAATAKRAADVSSKMVVVAEIMKHAVPASAPQFTEESVAEQRPTAVDGTTPSDAIKEKGDTHFDSKPDTIVAVTTSGNVVAGIERIKSQVVAAVEEGANTIGMTRFLERVGAVSSQRKHTAKDLLRFMERGDLPIADDGCIIIYKRLSRRGTDVYVDCHSKKVTQKVGSYVHMDISLVDHNRRNECSNGLHVARRGYIKNFSGDVCVLAKVRPEDVIAVPDYDANKMRVCGYHIIAELSAEQFQAVQYNRGIDSAEGGAELLGNAISGNHIGITQRVKINGSLGSSLEITDIVPDDSVEKPDAGDATTEESSKDVVVDKPPVVKKVVVKGRKAEKAKRKLATEKAQKPVKAKSLEAASTFKTATAVNPKDLLKLKEGTTNALPNASKGTPTQTEFVTALWDAALAGNRQKAQELLDFKKKAKKGWAVWGLPPEVSQILASLDKS